MNRRSLWDLCGWGFVLWFIGYVLGFVFFFIVPPQFIGWAIMPIGMVITLWVLLRKISSDSFNYYVKLAIVWTLIALVFDYFLIVKTLHPADGYYKLDVYLYYALTFALPLAVGWYKTTKQAKQ